MAALTGARVSFQGCKLLNMFSLSSRVNRVARLGVQSSFIALHPKRTLLSDAYHGEETWINRERIVVDMDEMKINLDRSFYDLKEPVMSVELHKYIDNVYDKEELDVAEGYLYSYRHSPMAHHLRQSTVHSWLRLCIELGYPEQALKVLQNKRDYGLFPEPLTYNLLLDTFLRADNIKCACDVAVVMMREETLEDSPLSQLLALYACHRYLKLGEIPQEEEWDIGMTLADATRNAEGALAVSYHAIGYAMTGRVGRAVAVLESTLARDGAKISQEAVDKLEAALDKHEELDTEVKNTFAAAVEELTEQGRILCANNDKDSSSSLDGLLEAEVASRLPDLECGGGNIADGNRDYMELLEGWHAEHMEALERQRLQVLEQERREKEARLDELLRATGGIKYWAKEIEEAQRRMGRREVEDGGRGVAEGVEHR